MESIKLKNGQEVNLSLNYAKLKLLGSINKNVKDEFVKINEGKPSDPLIAPAVNVYVAYWCENYGKTEQLLTLDEFLEFCPVNPQLLNEKMSALVTEKN